MKTKVCKVCGKEKPVNEFDSKGKGYYDSQCKTCKWFSKRNIDYKNISWKFDEDLFIIDSLLNKKYTINEISTYLNRDLRDLCKRILEDLKVGGTTRLPLTTKCANCGNIINIKPHELIKYNNNFCNKTCSNEYQVKHPYKKPTMIEKICPICNKTFTVTKHKKKQIHCCRECANLAKEDKVIIYCKICGKEIFVKRSMADKTATCSEECAVENRRRICEEKSNDNSMVKICEYCNKEYKVILSQSETSRFCCKKCHNKWMSEYLVGEKNPRFKKQLVKCDYCGEMHYQKLHRLNKQKHFFCSTECRQKWFSEYYSQTEEWRKQRSIIAVKALSSGLYSHIDTSPQEILNNLLDEMDIKYENEYNCKYYSLDNFLYEYGLGIECMGTFWHTDNRFYEEISSDIQVNRIRKDKAKKSYIHKNYNMPILYVWEYDLESNINLCKELILEFINFDGKMPNYHSFNYFLYDDTLFLDTKPIIPYMEWKTDDLNSIIDLQTKSKINKRDESKWITFDCEECGKEKQQLLSKYNKAKHHFCSLSCSSSYYFKDRVINKEGKIIG